MVQNRHPGKIGHLTALNLGRSCRPACYLRRTGFSPSGTAPSPGKYQNEPHSVGVQALACSRNAGFSRFSRQLCTHTRMGTNARSCAAMGRFVLFHQTISALDEALKISSDSNEFCASAVGLNFMTLRQV